MDAQTCPHCGYCPTCKRANPAPIWVVPYWERWYHPLQPMTTPYPPVIWSGTTTTTNVPPGSLAYINTTGTAAPSGPVAAY